MSTNAWLVTSQVLPASEPGAPVGLTYGTVQRVAGLLGVSETEIAGDLEGVLTAAGVELPAFAIRSGTWRIDLVPALARSAVGGLVAATVLRLIGADAVPVTVLAALAPALFEIREIDVSGSDALIHAQLRATVNEGPMSVEGLYKKLPDAIRDELTLTEFGDVIGRLLDARLVRVGRSGLRVRAPRASHGFRLVLWDAPYLPSALVLEDRHEVTAAVEESSAVVESDAATSLAPVFRPRVFICYAQESEDHKKNVRKLATLLMRCGIDVSLDQWVPPVRQDWMLWANQLIIDVDFVLVIASPTCRRVADGRNTAQENRGLASEMRTLRELLQEDVDQWRSRILPVILPGFGVQDVPLFLSPRSVDHLPVTGFDPAGAEDLLRMITGQPALRKPVLGPLIHLPPQEEDSD